MPIVPLVLPVVGYFICGRPVAVGSAKITLKVAPALLVLVTLPSLTHVCKLHKLVYFDGLVEERASVKQPLQMTGRVRARMRSCVRACVVRARVSVVSVKITHMTGMDVPILLISKAGENHA